MTLRTLITPIAAGLLIFLVWLCGGQTLVMALCSVLVAERWEASRLYRQEQKRQRRELFRDWGHALK